MARSKINPRKMSEEEYMQWHAAMREKFGNQVFEMCGLVIPKEFEAMSSYEQERLHEDNKEKLFQYQERMRSTDEAAIEEMGADFVTEEDWNFLSGRKSFTPEAVTFKMFKGRNYELEYVRSETDVHFHLFLPIGSILQETIFETFEGLLLKIVPRDWRVRFHYSRGVTPSSRVPGGKEMRDKFDLMNAYGIHFVDATSRPACHIVLENALRKILKDFTMPEHLKEGFDIGKFFKGE